MCNPMSAVSRTYLLGKANRRLDRPVFLLIQVDFDHLPVVFNSECMGYQRLEVNPSLLYIIDSYLKNVPSFTMHIGIAITFIANCQET